MIAVNNVIISLPMLSAKSIWIFMLAGITALPIYGVAAGTDVIGPNDPTPDSIVYNPFVRQNTHMNYGKGEYEYDCSGDVNQDGNISVEDAQAIYMGTKNRFADVNADGKVDANDGVAIEKAVNGEAPLPSDWEILSKDQKKEFALNYFNNVYIPKHNTVINNEGRPIVKYDGWDCKGYAYQPIMDIRGVQNAEEYKNHLTGILDELKNDYTTSNNGEGNLPIFFVATTSDYGNGHAINAMLIGENAADKSDWLFIDGQTGKEAGEETIFMRADKGDITSIDFVGHYIDWKGNPTYGGNLLLQWESNGDGTNTNIYTHPNLITTQNQDTEAPTYTATSSFDVEFEEKHKDENELEKMARNSLPTDVADNMDANPTTSFSYEVVGKTNNGSAGDSNFDVNVNFSASDASGNTNLSSYSIAVRDRTAPTADLEQPSVSTVDYGTNLDSMATAHVQNLYDASGTGKVELGERFERDGTEANHTYWDYPVSVTDATGNSTNLGIWEAPGIRDFPTGVPVVKNPEFVQAFTRGNEINIKYNPTHQGHITFRTVNMAGQVIDSRRISGYPDGEGNFSVNTSSPGVHVVQTVQETSGQQIVDVDKVVITRNE